MNEPMKEVQSVKEVVRFECCLNLLYIVANTHTL